MSPAGELQSSSHNANLIAPYASEKNRVRTSNNPYGLYGVQKSKIQTITRFNLTLLAVRVRTGTDRTGCTNFFREKMHFLRTGVDKRFDAHKATHPAATGQVDVFLHVIVLL